jgi:hypothetical protein
VVVANLHYAKAKKDKRVFYGQQFLEFSSVQIEKRKHLINIYVIMSNVISLLEIFRRNKSIKIKV